MRLEDYSKEEIKAVEKASGIPKQYIDNETRLQLMNTLYGTQIVLGMRFKKLWQQLKKSVRENWG